MVFSSFLILNIKEENEKRIKNEHVMMEKGGGEVGSFVKKEMRRKRTRRLRV